MKDITQNRTDDYPQGIIDGNAEIVCSDDNATVYNFRALFAWCERNGKKPIEMTDDELAQFIVKPKRD